MTSTTFFIIFIPILAILLLAINLLLAPHNPYQEKDSVFECGFHSFLGQNRTQFSVSFFIFALLFLLFDLEILLVYPYSVSGYSNDLYGLFIMLTFFSLLTLGFIFELGKNALSIESKQTTRQKNKALTLLGFFLNAMLSNSYLSPHKFTSSNLKSGLSSDNDSSKDKPSGKKRKISEDISDSESKDKPSVKKGKISENTSDNWTDNQTADAIKFSDYKDHYFIVYYKYSIKMLESLIVIARRKDNGKKITSAQEKKWADIHRELYNYYDPEEPKTEYEIEKKIRSDELVATKLTDRRENRTLPDYKPSGGETSDSDVSMDSSSTIDFGFLFITCPTLFEIPVIRLLVLVYTIYKSNKFFIKIYFTK